MQFCHGAGPVLRDDRQVVNDEQGDLVYDEDLLGSSSTVRSGEILVILG